MCAHVALLSLACLLVLPAHATLERQLALRTEALPPAHPTKLPNKHPEGVCESIDIRNNPKMLEKLRGCRVIEGVLQIVLMEYHNSTDFEKYSFPELVEITGHLLIFKVNLRSLSKLFPNLSVIRGRKLFRDYSLIIYQLKDLETIGLYSLTNITRGSVRIEKNSKLCYANTINWDLIAPARGHVIEQNRAENECGLCPSSVPPSSMVSTMPGSASQKAKECPVDIRSSNKKHLCWDQTHCQKVCKPECGERACSDSGECCDHTCIGGCTGPDSNQCRVCRDLSISHEQQTHCVTSCPGGLFKHHDRRCISDTECRKQRRPKESKNPNIKESTRFKPINGTCMFECPPGYDEDTKDGNATCKRCNGTCTRLCLPGKIDAIETIEIFRGCTVITGTLEISIKGGARVVKELESALGQITEIQGSLRVLRSYPLMSLQFLKSLRIIGGVVEDSKTSDHVQSLYISENPNLEELWDWETHGDIEIRTGKLFIHFNPKLCLQKLQRLQNMTHHKTFSHLEVAPDSNGDKAACDIVALSLTVSQRNTTTVVLKWNAFCPEDDRSLLGYLVYYIETSKPISRFEGRDACGDGWEVVDYPSGQDTVNLTSLPSAFNCFQNTSKFHILTGLKPFTNYAIYVKTYTLLSEKKGAQSPIIYVTTMPGQPSPPIITKLESVKPNELFIQWQPPLQPQGLITSYHVLVMWQEDRLEAMPPRDYCVQPPGADYDKTTTSMFSEVQRKKKEQQKAMQEVASCKCDAKPFVDNQDDLLDSIDFENQLQNKVYIRGGGDRSRRSTDSKMEENKGMPPRVENKTIRDGKYQVYWQDLWNQTELRVEHLLHSASYKVSVYACRRVDPDEINQTVIQNCSEPFFDNIRTKKLEGADDVRKVSAQALPTNTSTAAVRVRWEPPKYPNGVIVSYNVQHVRVDVENSTPVMQCVTRQRADQDNNQLILPNLPAGNYSVQVWATSYMGAGLPSAPVYFYLEDMERSSGATVQLVLGLGALLVLMLVLVVACVLYRMRAQLNSAGASKLFASVNPEYATSVYEPDEWEVPRDHIHFIRELGQGSFGMVYEGLAKDVVKGKPEMRCAVKTVNEHATERERIEFLNEASVMKAFDTPHVVRLLGVVSCGQPTLVVMELMECGDLKTYLRSHRPDADTQSRTVKANPPTLQRIKQMAIEIADGMAYLSAKKFVHRDLAARNCMVAGDLTVKVGDFGMTRDIYETDYYRKGTKGLLPVRWMSPESLKDGVFTSASDVWSFGVVLWEMATLAMQPYQGLSNDQVLRYVVEGGVMERPDNCPDSLYDLMRSCWTHRASTRPSFLQLVASLVPEAASHFQTLSFFHTPQGQELYAQQLLTGQEEEARTAEGGVECVPSSAGVVGSTSYGVSGRLASWARELASVRSSLARSDPDHAELLSALVSKPVQPPNGVLTRRDKDATSQC